MPPQAEPDVMQRLMGVPRIMDSIRAHYSRVASPDSLAPAAGVLAASHPSQHDVGFNAEGASMLTGAQGDAAATVVKLMITLWTNFLSLHKTADVATNEFSGRVTTLPLPGSMTFPMVPSSIFLFRLAQAARRPPSSCGTCGGGCCAPRTRC